MIISRDRSIEHPVVYAHKPYRAAHAITSARGPCAGKPATLQDLLRIAATSPARDRQCIDRFMRINTSRLGTSSHRRSFATANEAHRLITSKPTPCTGHADTHRTLASIIVRVPGPSCAIDRCEPIPCTDHAHTDHTELLQSSSRAHAARAPSTVTTPVYAHKPLVQTANA
ncbi:hypothetical protein [Burkholderia stagnalis]|uniref:hypothetical protein n=1 Tax=Burkholderia stagnalis TaxID=1503054 RepID=UPI000B1C72C3|nr:hypothetical protein [Burkholderia stagnalis]